MKKTHRRLLVLTLAAFCFAAAAMPAMAEEETAEAVTEAAVEEEAPGEEPVIGALGAWQAVEDIALTDELKEMFEKAVEDREDAEYEPVALLGEQVVAGMNYCFLSRAKDAPNAFCLVYIYKSPEFDAVVMGVRDPDFSGILYGMGIQIPDGSMEVEDMIAQAHYLYIDYDFNSDAPVGVYYIVNQANELYSIHTPDGARKGLARFASAKELLDNSFLSPEENGSLPVEGGKGILIWKNEDGLHAYARNYKDYGDEADIESLGYVENEEEITALLDSFAEELEEAPVIPESIKTE